MEKQRFYKIRRLVTASVLLALGMVLPLLTAQIKEIGDSLLPMHLVVMLCGTLCGWRYALPVGAVLPPLRSLLFGMPPIYPNAVWMAAELSAYGFVIGVLFARRRRFSRPYLLFCLGASMIAGRFVWGAVKAVLLGVAGKSFGLSAFLVGGFVDALPGIVLQLVLVPLITELVLRRFGEQESAMHDEPKNEGTVN